MVLADHRLVGGEHDDLETVDLLELRRLGVGGAGHPGELVVETKVVLEGDGSERLVLVLDRNAFLCLHRLVQPFRPPPTRHRPSRELIDDDDLPVVGDDVLDVALVQVRPEPGVDMVHEHDIGRVVETLPRREEPLLDQQMLDLLVALFGEEDLLRLLVHAEVARTLLFLLAGKTGDQPVDPDVELGVLVGRARDDEGSTGLVDEYRIDLVHDREAQRALHLVRGAKSHVVAQVVEAELVVGAVHDVRRVGFPFLRGGLARNHYPGAQAENGVDGAHPLRVAPREVVVHRHDVHALPVDCIEVDGKRGDEGLALSGAHLGDVAFVQRHAAEELHVEVAHVEGAPGRFADHREGFRKELLERLALLPSLAQRLRLSRQCVVREAPEGVLEGVDPGHDLAHAAQLPVVAAPDDLPDELVQHRWRTGEPERQGRTKSMGFTALPWRRTSKCTCGPVDRPLLPRRAMVWPLLTLSPGSTRISALCA